MRGDGTDGVVAHPEQVTVHAEDDGDQVVLTVRGELARTPARRVVAPALIKHLLDRGRVIVDLSEASVGWTPVVGLFPTALAQAGGWPLARLVLAAADPSTAKILQASRVHLTVPLTEDVDHARVMLGYRPPRVVRSHDLPYTPDAPLLARLLVNQVHQDWQLPDGLGDTALAVTTELVTNAVEHAQTGCELHLALDDHRLQIAVRDRQPDVPALPPRDAHDHDRGYGLLIVEGLSRKWGVRRHKNSKTVWALLDAATGTPGR